jgi:hypothetical protein
VVASLELSATREAGESVPLEVRHVAVRHSPRQGEEVEAFATEAHVWTRLPLALRHVVRPA